MLPSILLIAGGAFAASIAVGTVSAVVTRIKNRKKKTSTTEATKPQKVTKKMSLEKAREKLQKKIDEVNRESAKVDEAIRRKISSLQLDPDTAEHREFLTRAMKSRWTDAANKYVAQVTRTKEGLKKNDDFEAILAKVPTFVTAQQFVDKCETSIIPSVSEKYRYYISEKEKIDLSSLDITTDKEDKKSKSIVQSNRNSKVYASRDLISALLSRVENMVVNSTKVEDFRSYARADFRTISNEVETVKEFKKLKANLQKALQKAGQLEKATKANKTEIDHVIEELARQVEENKKSIDLIDLSEIEKTLKALEEKFGTMDEDISKKLTSFKTNINRLINLRISAAVKGKASAKEMTSFISEVRQIIAGFEGRLTAMDLLELSKKLEQLTEAYNKVDEHIDDTVRAEVEAMKESVKKGINISIGMRISKAMKEKGIAFNEQYREEIMKKATELAEKAASEKIGEKLTEEEMIDRIIDSINERYKFARK